MYIHVYVYVYTYIYIYVEVFVCLCLQIPVMAPSLALALGRILHPGASVKGPPNDQVSGGRFRVMHKDVQM